MFTTSNRLFRTTSLLAVTVLCVMPAGLQGQAITFETVALSGGTAPESGGAAFASFDSVQANAAGDLVFEAHLLHGQAGVDATNDQGIWRRRLGQSVEKIARSNDITPPYQTDAWYYNADPLVPGVTPARFRSLLPPVIGADGNVAFVSHLVVNNDTVKDWQDSALWVTGEGTISRSGEGTSAVSWMICRKGTGAYSAYDAQGQQTVDANGEVWAFENLFGPRIGPDGRITFNAVIGVWRGFVVEQRGRWYLDRPVPGPTFEPGHFFHRPYFSVVEAQEPAAVPGAEFDQFGLSPSVGGGETQFAGSLLEGAGGIDGMTNDGLWRSNGLAITAVVRSGDAAPGTPDRFYRFAHAATNEAGQSAFCASLVADVDPSLHPLHREGIWLHRFGGVEALALEGKLAPGCPGGEHFASFFDPVINTDGVTAFLAHVKGALDPPGATTGTGIWTGGIAESLRLVASTGATAPGAGGAPFCGLSSPRINGLGQIAFTGRLDRDGPGVTGDNDFGCWAMDASGSVHLVFREGMVHEVAPGDSRQVSSFRISDFSDAGELYFDVAFTDGSTAIVRAALPAVALVNYDDWAAGAIPNPAQRAGNLDIDGDGIVNLMEFAFGLNPLVADAGAVPRVIMTTAPDGGDLLSLAFPRRTDAADLTYQVMVSSDMINWTPATELVDARPTGEGLQEAVVRDISGASGAARRFIRVIVTDGEGS